MCNARRELFRKLRAVGIFSISAVAVKIPLNWKNTKSSIARSDCKFHLLVEEYSPVKSPSFHWGGKNIRRRMKVQQKGQMKEKALICCHLYHHKQKDWFYYYSPHALRAVRSRPTCCTTHVKESHFTTGILIYTRVFASIICSGESV